MSLDTIRGRSAPYLARRAVSLARRYGVRDRKARERVSRCVEALAPFEVMPTFATPGSVIERAPEFFRELQSMGVEFAIHGYHHVDFRSLEPDAARAQFERAADAFSRNGISFTGFRCPYLSYSDGLAPYIPEGCFEYSSNDAIRWDVLPVRDGGATFEQLAEFYGASPASDTVATPRFRGSLVEIPVSLPDDLQLLDGLRLPTDEVGTAWGAILEKTHERGELFAPLFHPESFDSLRSAIEDVLRQARARRPKVWMTQLRDIARWWKERAWFEATTSVDGRLLQVDFRCSDRGTVLARDWTGGGNTTAWADRYRVLSDRTVRVDPNERPFLGITSSREQTVRLFREQGYLLETGESASSCTVRIDERLDSTFKSDVERLAYVESTPGPLLKFSRWPNQASSALCFSGDLDALSLREYTDRLLPRHGRSGTRD